MNCFEVIEVINSEEGTERVTEFFHIPPFFVVLQQIGCCKKPKGFLFFTIFDTSTLFKNLIFCLKLGFHNKIPPFFFKTIRLSDVISAIPFYLSC